MTPTMPPVPRVSVVVPAYNAAHCVERAVDSVLAQTWQDFELLVVDDGSRDNTPGVLAALGPRVQVLAQPNAGPAAARNRGLQAAVGAYVAFLDADDWWEPGKLEAQVALLDARPEIGFCSTATRVIDDCGRPVGDWPCVAPILPLTDLLFSQSAAVSGSTSGVMARRSLLLGAGGFDTTLRGFEDPDLWIRLSARAAYVCIPDSLTVVVRTPGSVSADLPGMRRSTLTSFRKNRCLLARERRGGFWRAACAGALTDYAKAAWRAGDRGRALAWVTEALLRAPLARGRLAAGLLLAMLAGRDV